MPSVSKKQHDAMQAAAHGKSTLGIPKKVGKDFVDADKKAGKHQGGESGAHHDAEKRTKWTKTW